MNKELVVFGTIEYSTLTDIYTGNVTDIQGGKKYYLNDLLNKGYTIKQQSMIPQPNYSDHYKVLFTLEKQENLINE